MSSARKGNPHYEPDRFLDTLQRVFSVQNDRQLAFALGLYPPVICKIRHRKMDVPASLLIHLNEETQFSIRELRALMGDYREHSGDSATHPTAEELSLQRTVRVQMVPKGSQAEAAV